MPVVWRAVPLPAAEFFAVGTKKIFIRLFCSDFTAAYAQIRYQVPVSSGEVNAHRFCGADVLRGSVARLKQLACYRREMVEAINYENVKGSAHGRERSGFREHLKSACCLHREED
jgi:hypothetical protein